MTNVSSGASARVDIDGDTVAVQWRRKGGQWGPVKYYDGAPPDVLAIARAAQDGNASVGYDLAPAMRAAGLVARAVAE